MTARAESPVPVPTRLDIRPGLALLAGLETGPSLAAHRERHGDLPRVSLADLIESAERLRVRGRGGAAFPFAVKLRAAAQGRGASVVVNLSEGEPASSKDSALARARPHLMLDGAVVTARALKARELHVILPERPAAASSMQAAVAERHDRIKIVLHQADARFVAGQARAVLELMAGRRNLPVTAVVPVAVSGHRGRPTLLSNAETWAQVGQLVLAGERAYAAYGTADEPGTTLLTLSGPVPEVLEVPFGTRLEDVVPKSWHGRPVLLGGFHGTWLTEDAVRDSVVSVDALKEAGTPLGAGTLICPDEDPLQFTSRVVDYLAAQSAGRCGPCRNGLPALSGAVQVLAAHGDNQARVLELSELVTRRGACAHPDGTARLVLSALAAFAVRSEHGAGTS